MGITAALGWGKGVNECSSMIKSCGSRWDFSRKEKMFYALRKQSLGGWGAVFRSGCQGKKLEKKGLTAFEGILVWFACFFKMLSS